MTTQARIGHGTTFAIGNDSSPPTYTALAEVTNITPPGIARDAVEATHMQSFEKWREFVAGLKNAGEVSLETNFVTANLATIMGLFDTDVPQSCRITFINALGATLATWDFDAIATGYEPEAPLDDKIMATLTFQVTGKPALTIA